MDWSTFYAQQQMPDLDRMLSCPGEWQITLAERIREKVAGGKLLEAGSAYGLTSLLVGETAQRTLLDLEPRAIEVAQALFARAKEQASFTVGDLFAMPYPDDSFDVVFNAGVLEHFDFATRRAALREMLRVTRPGGVLCIAIPNHHSVPYRYAYEYRRARGRWAYPEEEMIYDFSGELADCPGARQLSRETISEHTAFHFLSKLQRIWFKLLHKVKHYEGYLTIITVKKGSVADD